jgi:hypothetical protein
LFNGLGFTNIREEAGMSRAAVGKVLAGFVQAERAVDGEADFGGILVLLAIVLPPANWAKSKRSNGLERLITAAWASKAQVRRFLHCGQTGEPGSRITCGQGNLRGLMLIAPWVDFQEAE